jgi:hypothetical protein
MLGSPRLKNTPAGGRGQEDGAGPRPLFNQPSVGRERWLMCRLKPEETWRRQCESRRTGLAPSALASGAVDVDTSGTKMALSHRSPTAYHQTPGGANELRSLGCPATSHICPRFVNPPGRLSPAGAGGFDGPGRRSSPQGLRSRADGARICRGAGIELLSVSVYNRQESQTTCRCCREVKEGRWRTKRRQPRPRADGAPN